MAENDVLAGIQVTSRWLQEGWFNIAPSCEYAQRDMSNYNWDEKAGELGEDRPVKSDDHGADMIRYLCFSRAVWGGRRGAKVL